MKKLLSVVLLLILTSYAVKAQLPYSKMLGLTKEQLEEGKFKYKKDKNQYVLIKSNGLNSAINVLSAMNGQAADVKPHVDDYTIIVQNGETEVSSLSVMFYKDATFHDIQTWLAENNIDVLETNSGKLTIQKFNYENYAIELALERIGKTATVGNTGALAKSIDESYNVYTYTINTGVPPFSKWHEKQALKKAKDAEKGKKKDLEDLM